MSPWQCSKPSVEALKRGFCVAHELRDENFGMRHFMVADPNGLLVNILAFP
jgi:uncharacterized glyoxalase superfamily protein PhnB